jgi:hypothetical protein
LPSIYKYLLADLVWHLQRIVQHVIDRTALLRCPSCRSYKANPSLRGHVLQGSSSQNAAPQTELGYVICDVSGLLRRLHHWRILSAIACLTTCSQPRVVFAGGSGSAGGAAERLSLPKPAIMPLAAGVAVWPAGSSAAWTPPLATGQLALLGLRPGQGPRRAGRGSGRMAGRKALTLKAPCGGTVRTALVLVLDLVCWR